jgi:hypothetical protein
MRINLYQKRNIEFRDSLEECFVLPYSVKKMNQHEEIMSSHKNYYYYLLLKNLKTLGKATLGPLWQQLAGVE